MVYYHFFFQTLLVFTGVSTYQAATHFPRGPRLTTLERYHHHHHPLPLIHLGSSEELILPKINNFQLHTKSRPSYKTYAPSFTSWEDVKKFYSDFGKTNKKPKYWKHPSVGKLKSSFKAADVGYGKKCCGNEWAALLKTVPSSLHFTEPVLGYEHNPGNQFYGYSNSDVKPVVEHIEDDIKYDFRTKTHSI